jgi:hypothetical protein
MLAFPRRGFFAGWFMEGSVLSSLDKSSSSSSWSEARVLRFLVTRRGGTAVVVGFADRAVVLVDLVDLADLVVAVAVPATPEDAAALARVMRLGGLATSMATEGGYMNAKNKIEFTYEAIGVVMRDVGAGLTKLM